LHGSGRIGRRLPLGYDRLHGAGEFHGFVIEKHGMREPITLFEGKVLDGRNRVAAVKGINGYFPQAQFEGTFEQARDYVISLNLIRRHLETGQRAMIAADLANMPHGGDRSKGQNCTLMPIETAAKQSKVSPRTVKTAKAIKKADPALAEEVKQGKVKLSTAAKQVEEKKTAKNSDATPTKLTGASRKELDQFISKLETVCEKYDHDGLTVIVDVLIDNYGYDRVSDEVLEHNP
jgi:hypothetical protein